MKKKVYIFDFDGTVTTADTLLLFIRYACGTWRFVLGFALFSPLLVLMKLGLYPNYKAKRHIFSWYFRGMALSRFDGLCRAFAAANAGIVRPGALSLLKRLFAEGADVMVVSASVDNWVAPFFIGLADGSTSRFAVEGTRVEVAGGVLTGRFVTHNCYGPEKVARVRAHYPDRSACHIVAFGDSRGDRELLAYADEAHYRPFRDGSDNVV